MNIDLMTRGLKSGFLKNFSRLNKILKIQLYFLCRYSNPQKIFIIAIDGLVNGIFESLFFHGGES
jgi:hypothetical protein